MLIMNYPPYTQTRPALLLKEGISVSPNSIVEDCDIGHGTRIWHHCNLYRCMVGVLCEIGSFVEIGEGVVIGDKCKVLPYAFIPPGVKIGDRCFIGPHVSFSNDPYPTVVQKEVVETVVHCDVSIGAGSIILPGVTIARGVMIGSGALVTKSILEEDVVVYGHPAQIRRKR